MTKRAIVRPNNRLSPSLLIVVDVVGGAGVSSIPRLKEVKCLVVILTSFVTPSGKRRSLDSRP